MKGRWARRLLPLMPLLLWAGSAAVLSAQSYRITHLVGGPGGGGFLDGPAANARFNRLVGVAVDSSGTVYVADSGNDVIRKIGPTGVVTTLAGLPGVAGSSDGTGSAARFAFPQGIATDSAGNVFVADSSNSTIRKVTPVGVVTTIAGTPGRTGGTDGTGSAALFFFPTAIATDAAGNLYVVDSDSDFEPNGKGFSTIRKITPAGVVTTLAGSATVRGYRDGSGTDALFDFGDEGALVADNAGNLYVADSDNLTVREVTPAGIVSTLAGNPSCPNLTDGTGSAACFLDPNGIGFDGAGNLYLGDGGVAIRKVTPSGAVTTIAGAQTLGFVDGTGADARFDGTENLTSDGVNLFIPDTINNAVRKVVIATTVVTTLAGGSPIFAGSTDGIGTAARFSFPTALATDGRNLYVADSGNSTIRQVSPSGQVTTLAGTPGVLGSADGTGSAVSFGFSQSTAAPYSLATDGTNLYIPDSQNSTIRKLVIATGQVTTIAGTAGVPGSTDGVGAAARFLAPRGITTDGTNLYVVETGNSTIRQIVIATGEVTTLAGSPGVTGSSDGVGSVARFNLPTDITGDGTNLYVVDRQNSTIRKIVIATRQVTTIAGVASPPGSGFSDGIGSAARFNAPQGITTDGANLYVTDGVIRGIVIATGQVSTVAGTPGWRGGMDGTGAGPLFFAPVGIVFANNFIFVADTRNNDIREGACTADTPVSPVATPLGNSTGPVTGVDFLDLTWSPPASGLTPNGYDWAINGDSFTAESGISVTAPPRGSNDPITLHVRGRACNPEVAGSAVDSPTYSPAPPAASFSASAPASPGATVTFTDTSDPQATSWLWLFGDGAIATTQSTNHTFPSRGIYSVVLVASNGAGSSQTSHPQTVQSIASLPQGIRSTRVFDTTDPERQRLERARIAGPGGSWLHIFSGEGEEIVVYLRFRDALGRLARERRLSVAPGQEALYDLGAYGLHGVWTLELVSAHKFDAFLEERDSNGPKGERNGLR